MERFGSIVFLLVATLSIGYLFYERYYGSDQPYTLLIDVPEFVNNHPDRLKTIGITDLHDEHLDFSDLAEEGFYTVVMVRSIDCKSCLRMEENFSALLDVRPDIRIFKIDIPSEHIQFDQSSGRKKFERKLRSATDHYGISGVPKIIIFQQNRSLYKNSRHGSRAGEVLLSKWLERAL